MSAPAAGTAAHYGLDFRNPPPLPELEPWEVLLCLWPGCNLQIDPVAWPYHPSHDITPEQWAAWDREQQDELAHDDAVRELETRRFVAHERAAAAPAPKQKKPAKTNQLSLPRSSR